VDEFYFLCYSVLGKKNYLNPSERDFETINFKIRTLTNFQFNIAAPPLPGNPLHVRLCFVLCHSRCGVRSLSLPCPYILPRCTW